MAGFVGNAQVPVRSAISASGSDPVEIAVPQNAVRVVFTQVGEDMRWTKSTSASAAVITIAAPATSGIILSGSLGEVEVAGWFNEGSSFWFRAASGAGGAGISFYLIFE